MYVMSFGLALHCEHHDFPRIPAHRLHKVRHIAPEYYKDIKSYDSVWEPIGSYLNDLVRALCSALGFYWCLHTTAVAAVVQDRVTYVFCMDS